MKQKKLFGKLNIIDILLILVLIVAIVLVALYLTKSRGEDGSTAPSEPNFRFTVMCEDLRADMADHVVSSFDGEPRNAGGVMVSPRRIYNNNQVLDGEIVSWQILPAEDGRVDLQVTVECSIDTSSTALTLGIQDIRIGISYILKTINMELNGYVLSMEALS